MTSALHAVRQVFWRTRTSPCSLFEAVAIAPCRRAKATTSASKHKRGVTCRSATYQINASSARGAAISKVLRLSRTVPKKQHHYYCSLPPNRSVACGHAPGQSPAALAHSAFFDAAAGMTRSARIGKRCSSASVGFIRSFGGQSVVPWELALFLVEEMKGEMVQPGAVVYTAALAECRWAGKKRHVDYILEEMKAEGLSIVPGIPGATDDDPPPSQSPPLFGKHPEPPPNSVTPRRQPGTAGAVQHATAAAAAAAAAAVEKMQEAARAAEAALATVETMWAREEHDPSPTTCRAALDACAAGGQWERALSLVRDAASPAEPDASVRSDETEEEAAGVSGRVEVLALEGRWDEALLRSLSRFNLEGTHPEVYLISRSWSLCRSDGVNTGVPEG
ncbi:unnamed protein product [Ectocarpus fasciculatus]